MKIPTDKPKSAYAHRREGTWEAFLFKLDLNSDDAFTLVWWWSAPETVRLRAELPEHWQEHAEEEYERRLEMLRRR